MSVKNVRLCVALLMCALGVARGATADPVVIYSNFGPSPGYTFSGWLNSDENAYFMGFQLDASARMTSVTLPVRWGGDLPGGGFSVSLYGSSEGGPDFSGRGEAGLIERIVVPLPADAQPRTVSMLTLTSTVQPVLSAGTLYFLGDFVVAPSTFTAIATLWPMNSAGIQGLVVNNSPGGNFITQGTLGAFQLNGEPSPIPEPSTMLMFATGVGLVAERLRRRRISG